MGLTHHQMEVLTIVERSASVLSTIGIATIIGTFCFSRQFRNPIQRIVFINAFYNIFDVTATFISLSGPEAGNSSRLCQFQGFLMQMFPLADVLWTLAMAIDVFLIVFYKYDTEDLHKLEIKYIAIITALVFIPAASFLFVHTKERGPMFGSVTIWCSISPHWVLFRILFFYGPIWLTIFIVIILYLLVGFEILKQRRFFKSLGNEFVTLDSIHNIQLDNTVVTTIEGNVPSPTYHPNPHDSGKDLAFDTSATASTSSKRPPTGAFDNQPPRRPPVSFRKYILMPLMFFFLLLAIWVAPTVNRVASFINPDFVSFPLYLAVGSMGSLRGFWNGVVFMVIGMKERKRKKNRGRIT
ncbi:putative cAMP receptor [Hyaloscypha variabilis F]|uniref:Putative cAMP receptor n=1 Tax=Hyaloscypha variabilis (strain UAMH 11265 / GT02V1 / F) TaxID=1149755 RepID=A0A2J6S4W3_HYAVF|nr:putative cAMP receptor [Hyaloscypha variabilis F]